MYTYKYVHGGKKIPIYLGINDICLQKIVPQVGVDPLSALSGQTLMVACKNKFLFLLLQ